jgi:hypothetical protein
MSNCVIQCGRPSASRMCGDCWLDLRNALYQVEFLLAELETTYMRDDRQGAEVGVRSQSRERPLPWRETASDAIQGLQSTLHIWSRELLGGHLEIGRLTPVEQATALSHYPKARHYAAVENYYEDVMDAIKEAQRIIDRPADKLYAGECECSAHLWAKLDERQVKCSHCGTLHPVEGRRRAMIDKIGQQVLNAAQISRLLAGLGLDVKASTIRSASIDRPNRPAKLYPAAWDERGRPQYRVGDVLDALTRLKLR